MTSTLHEPTVFIRTPMAPNYTYVPKGNVYITGNCRKQTHAAGKTVYVVHDSKKRQIGIRVPLAVYQAVLISHNETKESRAQAVQKKDDKMNDEFRKSVLAQYPQIPTDELPKLVTYTMRKGSRRVGRTGKLEIAAKAQLAVRAYIRHCHTEYDSLLKNGVSRESAREQIHSKIDDVVNKWGWSSISVKAKDKRSAKPRDYGKQRTTRGKPKNGSPSQPRGSTKKTEIRRHSASTAVAKQLQATPSLDDVN
ncbi:hypothetical protein F5B20DRAFT_94276 [Whalleya microplaca]|nr:hypothetical protein F5B20DRAFT_94276 [Whalleya microplaca]